MSYQDDISPIVNIPRKLLWHNGRVEHLLPFSFVDLRSTLNGKIYFILAFNLNHIEVAPEDFPKSNREIYLSDNDKYKELVSNMEALLENGWEPFDIIQEFSNSNPNNDKLEILFEHLLPSYQRMFRFYGTSWFLSKDEHKSSFNKILDSLEEEIKILRSKYNSGFSGDEYFNSESRKTIV